MSQKLLWLLAIMTCVWAHPPQPAGPPGRPILNAPKAGVCPLPILPALPDYANAAFFAKDDVPHGKIEQPTYKNYAGVEKRLHVYVPPDYSSDAKYPVLYLNHGGGGDDANWSSEDPKRGGNAQFILENLIAAGKAKPMLIVMP